MGNKTHHDPFIDTSHEEQVFLGTRRTIPKRWLKFDPTESTDYGVIVNVPCIHCRNVMEQHVDRQCLFMATKYTRFTGKTLDHYVYRLGQMVFGDDWSEGRSIQQIHFDFSPDPLIEMSLVFHPSGKARYIGPVGKLGKASVHSNVLDQDSNVHLWILEESKKVARRQGLLPIETQAFPLSTFTRNMG